MVNKQEKIKLNLLYDTEENLIITFLKPSFFEGKVPNSLNSRLVIPVEKLNDVIKLVQETI